MGSLTLEIDHLSFQSRAKCPVQNELCFSCKMVTIPKNGVFKTRFVGNSKNQTKPTNEMNQVWLASATSANKEQQNRIELHEIHLKINYSMGRNEVRRTDKKIPFYETKVFIKLHQITFSFRCIIAQRMTKRDSFCGFKIKYFKSHQNDKKMEFPQLSTKSDCLRKLTASGTFVLNFLRALCAWKQTNNQNRQEKKAHNAQLRSSWKKTPE